jgi:ABC-2 type transport system ATP-binding protein
MDKLLRVRALERRYGAKTALRGLDFTLEPGDVLGLLGPNGAGKTTCLRVLSGNLAPTAGSVHIRGHDMLRAPLAAGRHLGYLPERPPLYPEMRVDEYLHFCARLHRIAAGSIGRAVARIKRHCGLEQVGRRLLGKLSKGYQQRTGLARALIHEPDLVILDEPTDGLDPELMREVRALIRDLAPNAGVLVSSHALGEVQAVCNRVIILRDGEVLHQARLAAADAGQRLVIGLRNAPAETALAEAEALSVEPLSGALSGRLLTIESADGGAGLRFLVTDGGRRWSRLDQRVSYVFALPPLTEFTADLEQTSSDPRQTDDPFAPAPGAGDAPLSPPEEERPRLELQPPGRDDAGPDEDWRPALDRLETIMPTEKLTP